jgi:hypothetical protein
MIDAVSPVRRKVRPHVPHGVRPQIVVTIYPDATIGLRELGRAVRTEQRFDVGQLYVGAVASAVARMNRRVQALRRAGLGLSEARRTARREVGL